MEDHSLIETYTCSWDGHRIEVRYQARSFAGYAHLQVIEQDGRPLPVSETGYKSLFLLPAEIEQYGGAVAFVEEWLHTDAQTDEWEQRSQQDEQLLLW